MSGGRRPTIDSPSSVMSPSRGFSTPEITRRIVVLPAPFVPSSATISPSWTSRSIPNKTSIGPYEAWTRSSRSNRALPRRGGILLAPAGPAQVGLEHTVLVHDLARRVLRDDPPE